MDECSVASYVRAQLVLSSSPVPTYAVPGAYDYPSCPDPALGWERWQEHIQPIDAAGP